MRLHSRFLVFFLVLALPLSAVPLTARAAGPAHLVTVALLAGPKVKQQRASNAAEAAKIARQRHGGKILKVDTLKTSEGLRYRVKLLQDDGRVKTVIVNG